MEKREAAAQSIRKILTQDLHELVDEYHSSRGLLFEPGTRFCYSDGHNIVAAIVEQLSGKQFKDFVQDCITGPLGMHDTAFHHSLEHSKRVPSIAIDTSDLDHPFPSCFKCILQKLGLSKLWLVPKVSAPKLVRGDVGLKGTVADLIRLNQMLLNDGELDGVRILSKASVDAMCTNTLPGDGDLVSPLSFGAMPSEDQRTPYFGIEADQLDKYRGLNSYPGHGFGLGVAVVNDPAKAGLVQNASGTCWWQGYASTFFAFNRNTDIGCLVFAQRCGCLRRQKALADVINAAHVMLAGDSLRF